MKAYLDLIENILTKGVRKPNRTGVDTIGIFGAMVQFDMSQGFPLQTTRKVPYKSVRIELEGFIGGVTNKRWYQERDCHYWDEWCNPKVVPYSTDPEVQARMGEEPDLGKIYGYQWRNFNSDGCDQMAKVVAKLKSDPSDRRMIVSAWNPLQLGEMALPPCHLMWMVGVGEGKLNLMFVMRSIDTVLGLPSNVSSYATLLHLLAKESNLKEGTLTGQLWDVHIYVNHLEGVQELMKREPKKLPTIKTEKFTSIFDWKHDDTTLVGYDPHPPIKFQIAI